jgi:hypothetical protein
MVAAMNSYPPPADGLRLSSVAARRVAGFALALAAILAGMTFLAPPVPFVCRYALDFHGNRTVPSYVGRPLDEALREDSYCIDPTHSEIACDPREATVVSQSIAGPQSPLHSTSDLRFVAEC